MNLNLIGTYHFDLKGKKRLENVLNILKPETVVLEGIKATEEEKQYLEMIRSIVVDDEKLNLAVKNYMSFYSLKYPGTITEFFKNYSFEDLVLENYCNSTNSKIMYFDSEKEIKKLDSNILKINDKEINEKMILSQINNIISKPLNDAFNCVEKQYALSRSSQAYNIDFGTSLTARDKIIEQKIRKLSGNILFVVGADHLFAKGNNLYERLKDLKPKRFMLNEFD